MEGSHSLPVIAADLKQQFESDLATDTLAKCTKSCFMSMKEQKLLPTEERCLRNCFVKTNAFNSYFESELNYAMRHLQWLDYYLNGLILLIVRIIFNSLLSRYRRRSELLRLFEYTLVQVAHASEVIQSMDAVLSKTEEEQQSNIQVCKEATSYEARSAYWNEKKSRAKYIG